MKDFIGYLRNHNGEGHYCYYIRDWTGKYQIQMR